MRNKNIFILFLLCVLFGYAQQKNEQHRDTLFLKYDEQYLERFSPKTQRRHKVKLPFINRYNVIYISEFRDIDTNQVVDVKKINLYFDQKKYKDSNGIFSRHKFYLDNKPKRVFLVSKDRISQILFFHTLE